MNTDRAINLLLGLFLITLLCSPLMAAGQVAERTPPRAITFFDVPDLPARIDEPKLDFENRAPVVSCAVANRSSEQLLGLRMLLLTIDRSGKAQKLISWTEPAELAANSIKTFVFHPAIKETPDPTYRFYLAIDEVFGPETIWRAMNAEKSLRAFSQEQQNMIPTVRTEANKFDRRSNALKTIF